MVFNKKCILRIWDVNDVQQSLKQTNPVVETCITQYSLTSQERYNSLPFGIGTYKQKALLKTTTVV